MQCPKCGLTIGDNDTFCAYCGVVIENPQPVRAPVPPQAGPAAPTEPVMGSSWVTSSAPEPAARPVTPKAPVPQASPVRPAPRAPEPAPVRAQTPPSGHATGVTGMTAQFISDRQRAAAHTPPPPAQTYRPAPGGQSPSAKKSGGAAAAAIVLVLAAAVAAVVLFVKPGILKPGGDSSAADSAVSSAANGGGRPSHTSAGNTESIDTGTEGNSGSAETAPAETLSPGETTQPEEKSETTTKAAETTTAATTTKAAETTKATTTAPEENFDDDNAAYSEAMNISTYDRPDFSEFEWCFGQNGFIYEPQGNIQKLTNPLSWSGGWKAMVIYNPTNSAGTFIRELDNVYIGVYGDSADLTIDWYLMSNDIGEPENEEDMEDSNFFGVVTKDGLELFGDAEIELNHFWKEDGHEFALGTITPGDGIPAYFALTRP